MSYPWYYYAIGSFATIGGVMVLIYVIDHRKVIFDSINDSTAKIKNLVTFKGVYGTYHLSDAYQNHVLHKNITDQKIMIGNSNAKTVNEIFGDYKGSRPSTRKTGNYIGITVDSEFNNNTKNHVLFEYIKQHVNDGEIVVVGLGKDKNRDYDELAVIWLDGEKNYNVFDRNKTEKHKNLSVIANTTLRLPHLKTVYNNYLKDQTYKPDSTYTPPAPSKYDDRIDMLIDLKGRAQDEKDAAFRHLNNPAVQGTRHYQDAERDYAKASANVDSIDKSIADVKFAKRTLRPIPEAKIEEQIEKVYIQETDIDPFAPEEIAAFKEKLISARNEPAISESSSQSIPDIEEFPEEGL